MLIKSLDKEHLQLKINISKLVVHTFNHSYLGGGDRKMMVGDLPSQNFMSFYLKSKQGYVSPCRKHQLTQEVEIRGSHKM
jgi:hypothetical protein